MPCSILELQHVDEMWKRQNTKGNVEMKDLVLGKNDTDNLCIFDKKWEWTVEDVRKALFWSSFATQLIHVFEHLQQNYAKERKTEMSRIKSVC